MMSDGSHDRSAVNSHVSLCLQARRLRARPSAARCDKARMGGRDTYLLSSF
jgi:hypothetical protein